MARDSYIRVTTGAHPLSDGLRGDAKMVAQLRADFAAGEVSLPRMAEMLRHIEQRLLWRAGEAEGVEQAAMSRMGVAK